jgi:hypothetical protein
MVSYMSGPLLGHLEAGAVAAAFGVTGFRCLRDEGIEMRRAAGGIHF